MWGGVKKRTQYGDIFRKWSATRGLDELRIALFKEPRPWYLAYALHQHNHLLQDHHCARLLAWNTSVVELRPGLASKQEAYRYAQEMFQLLMRHHKVGKETLQEYMRLCAVGADLTSAFDWFKYWQEAQLGDCAALHTLTWLLQVAHTSPNDERVEDMALTVMDLYLQRFAGPSETTELPSEVATAPQRRDAPSTPSFAHYAPTSPEDAEALHRFFSMFKALEPRLRQSSTLADFLHSLPLSFAEAAANCAAFGWPTRSSHRLFPQLEQRRHARAYAQEDALLYADTVEPRLRDSLLHPGFVARLEKCANSRDVAGIVALVEEYEQRVKAEKAKAAAGHPQRRSSRSGDDDELWTRHADPSAVAFRRRVLDEGGVTPELYHYLVTALATTQPTAALRTLDGMATANLRPLDLTRAAVLVAVRESAAEQQRLFRAQLDEIDARARLDADHNTHKVVEAYWKYDYVDFFHHRNALSKADFYLYLMARLGPQPVQELLLSAQTHGALTTSEDLVVLDDDLRHASRLFFRSRVGRGPVQAALDAISHHMPKLDVSLVGTLPHFENYYIEAADEIAHSEEAIAALVRPYETIYVLDTSFVETSESFLSVGATDASPTKNGSNNLPAAQSLVLIPYLALSQLAASVASSNTFTSFDPAMQQAIRSEPFLASQRLRALFAMICSSAAPPQSAQTTAAGAAHPPSHTPTRRARVLHFTECLCAQQVDPAVLQSVHLSPAANDNDQLLLVLAMLSCVKPRTSRLVLCTDDTQLVEQLEALQTSPLFGSAVEVVSTAPPANMDVEKDLIDDNPILRDEEWNANDAGFEPQLEVAAEIASQLSACSFSEAEGEAASSDNSAPQKVNLRRESVDVSDSPNAAAALSPTSSSEDPMDSPWLALLNEDADSEVEVTKNTVDATSALDATTPTSPDMRNAAADGSSLETATSLHALSAEEQERRERRMSLYETPYDVVPIGVRMQDASALGSVFEEFDSMDPEQREQRAAERAAATSRLTQAGADGSSADGASQRRGRPHRRSALEKEMLANRGYSNKYRFQMARRLSNQSGARVPFNMRYRVVEANVQDPRNAHLRKVYQESLEKKRAIYKRRHG